MKTALNMALRLTLICAVAAYALANIAELTKGPIAESEARAQREAVEAVLPEFANLAIDTLGTEVANVHLYFSGVQDSEITGTAFSSISGLGYSGEIEIMLGVDTEGLVSGVRILRHAETPGLGANYADPALLEKFYVGRPMVANWKLVKDGGEVDAVTGATVTGRAIADAIEIGVKKYQHDKADIKAEVVPETPEGNLP